MPESRRSRSLPGWGWIAAVAILVGVPLVASIAVPTPRPARVPSAAPSPSSTAPPSALAPPAVAPPEAAPTPSQGDPDLGASTQSTPYDAAYDAIGAEQAALLIEKAAIEAEGSRIRGMREELEAFERDHPNGAPPELFSRYEDARARYNSDVRAFKSRASVYTMKVADLDRRIEALRTAALGTAAP